MLQMGLNKFLWLKYFKTLCLRNMLLVILTVKKFLERFAKKNCHRRNQKGFRVEKVIKRKDDKLYDKCKGYDNFFNIWINKKDI